VVDEAIVLSTDEKSAKVAALCDICDFNFTGTLTEIEVTYSPTVITGEEY
jgi:hypothetical protein